MAFRATEVVAGSREKTLLRRAQVANAKHKPCYFGDADSNLKQTSEKHMTGTSAKKQKQKAAATHIRVVCVCVCVKDLHGQKLAAPLTGNKAMLSSEAVQLSTRAHSYWFRKNILVPASAKALKITCPQSARQTPHKIKK